MGRLIGSPFIVGSLAVSLAVASITSPAAVAAEGEWDAPVTISPPGTDAFEPALFTDGSTIAAAWTSLATSEVFFSRSTDAGATWSEATPLATPGSFSSSPQLAGDGTRLTAVWRQFVNGPPARIVAYSASSLDGGVTWSDGVRISSLAESALQVQVATDGETITSVWVAEISGEDDQITASSSTDGGLTWSSPQRLSDASTRAAEPRLAAAAGTVTAVWHLGFGASRTVQTSTSTDLGLSWSVPVNLSADGAGAQTPEIATDGTTVAVSWSTTSPDSRIQVTTTTDAGATWTPTVTFSAPPAAAASDPSIDIESGVIALALAYRLGVENLIQTATSVDGGAHWSTAMTISEPGEDAFSPVVNVSEGRISIAWGRFDGSAFRTQVSVSTDGGTSYSVPLTLGGPRPGADETRIAGAGATTTVLWTQTEGEIRRVLASSFTVPGPDEPGELEVERIAGSDRYATAVAIAQRFPANVPVVYLATGTNYPDALSAASAAASQGGPLVLTPPNSLPTIVATELQRLNPSLVVIAGGTGVVSSNVVDRVRQVLPGATVRRDSGNNRYETSRIIAARAFSGGSTTAYIATGTNFPDALSASAVAGAIGAPVVLVNGAARSIDEATLDLLDDLGVSSVTIVGGTGVVSQGIENDLDDVFGSQEVRRQSGPDRYLTSVAINRFAFDTADTVFLATGLGFADALAGAALAGREQSPLYVVPGRCVPAPVLVDIEQLGAQSVVLLGGTGVLTSAVANLRSC